MTPEPDDNQADALDGLPLEVQRFILTATPAQRVRFICALVSDELEAGGDPSVCVAWLYQFSEGYLSALAAHWQPGATIN